MHIPERSNARDFVIPYFFLFKRTVQRHRKFSAVMGTTSERSSISIRPCEWHDVIQKVRPPHIVGNFIKIFRPSLCYLGRATNTNVHENYRSFACHDDAIVWLQSSLIFPFFSCSLNMMQIFSGHGMWHLSHQMQRATWASWACFKVWILLIDSHSVSILIFFSHTNQTSVSQWNETMDGTHEVP